MDAIQTSPDHKICAEANPYGPTYNNYDNNAALMRRPILLLSPSLPCSTYLSLLLLRCTTRAEGGELKWRLELEKIERLYY
eukprot:scaffold34963_cov155-Skeletonema_dohrnii-CCMP3373.AAC.1